jgi:hypothetical protein
MRPPMPEMPTPKYIINKEEYPLPTSSTPTVARKEIVTTVEKILNGGGVQKIVVALNQPIRVYRKVLTDGIPMVEELVDGDLISAIRNVEMGTIPQHPGMGPFQTLLLAFGEVTSRRLAPRAFMVSSEKELRDWFGVGPEWLTSEVFGVEVVVHGEIPSETALLVASVYDDPADVVFSVRMEMEKDKAL